MDKQINLAPQDQLSSSTWGKALSWCLSYGRYIVVITELVVISAFISRFFFDNQLRNLSSSVEQKVAIISANSDFENNFRNTQDKLSKISSLINSQTPSNRFFADIENLLPQPIYISQLSLNENTITFQGTAPTETSLIQLLNNLKTHPALSDVNLGQLSTQTDKTSGITFSVTAKWQKTVDTTNQ